MKNVLPSIKMIEYIDASACSIETTGLIYEGLVLTNVYGIFTQLDSENLGSLSVTSEKQSGEDIYTSLLDFTISEEIGKTSLLLALLSRKPTCYKITDVYGQKYLLGTNEKPFPAFTFKYSNESTPTGQRSFACEIKYINRFSVLAIQ
jgi:hypothetical protein